MAKSKYFLATFILFSVIIFCAWRFPQQTLKERVDEYLSSPAKTPDTNLVNDLRNGKYETLDWMYEAYWHDSLNYQSYRKNRKFLDLFDRVSGQKDAVSSGLFWFTNLEEAKGEAARLDKPILCLEMLGDLREDFSCANSRFFRTLLYSNTAIASNLRNNYVLCWESVIKVPKVTIEYPDGKKQVQTITGNSMHMVLNSKGEILDALPGLYGPSFFNTWLKQLSQKNSNETTDRLQQVSLGKLEDKTLVKMVSDEIWNELVIEGDPYQKMPEKAISASQISVAKVQMETPLYTSIFTWNKKRFKSLPSKEEEGFRYSNFGFYWESLDNSTLELIAAKKAYGNSELANTLRDLSNKLSVESVRNEVKIHVTILKWLQKDRKNKKYFVNKVYKELFLTPLDDKRMGLYDKSIYTGTTDDGFLEE
jgi:hypothetical protein